MLLSVWCPTLAYGLFRSRQHGLLGSVKCWFVGLAVRRAILVLLVLCQYPPFILGYRTLNPFGGQGVKRHGKEPPKMSNFLLKYITLFTHR
jgi:hypothetical protein